MHYYLPVNYNTTVKNNLMDTFKLAFVGEAVKDMNVSIGMLPKEWYIYYIFMITLINQWVE